MSKINSMKNLLIFGIAGVIYTSAILTPSFIEINDAIPKSIAILLIAQLLWITRIIGYAETSMIVIILIALTVTPFHTIMLIFGSEIIWLLFSTFILSGALIETGLASRISFYILKQSKGNIALLTLSLLFIMTILTLLIPTTVGRTALISAIIYGIIHSLNNLTKIDNVAKSLFIGINIMGVMGGALLMTASNSSIYALGLFRDLSDLNWDFLFWIKVFAPPIYIFMLALWFLLISQFPSENKSVDSIVKYIEKELLKLGPFSKDEKKILFLFSVMFILWIAEPIHHFSVSMVAFSMATLTMLPKLGVWKWEKAKQSIDWEIIIFFGVSLLLARTLIQTDALTFIASLIGNVKINIYIVPFIVGIISMLIRILFVNVLGFMTIMLPLGIAVADSLMINPLWFIMIIFLTGGPGFFFITQTPTNLITYRYNYYSTQDYWRVGIRASIIWLIVVALTALFYWPLLEIPIFI